MTIIAMRDKKAPVIAPEVKKQMADSDFEATVRANPERTFEILLLSKHAQWIADKASAIIEASCTPGVKPRTIHHTQET